MYIFREAAKRKRTECENEVAKLGEMLAAAKREVHNLETASREVRAAEARFEELTYKYEEEAKRHQDAARRLDEEADMLDPDRYLQ